MKEDNMLIQGLKQRNSRSLEAAIDMYGETVYALCARILSGLGKQEDIEECVSDTFLAAWQKIGEFQPARGSFRTWILILAKYKALDRRRLLSNNREEATILSPVPDPKPEHAFSKVETRRDMVETLLTLSKLDRELVFRRYYLYEDIDQLAKDHNLTPRAVYNRLWRARKLMIEKLSPAGEGGMR